MANINQAADQNPPFPQDWGVWAEINYLDSPTEYREYLCTNPLQSELTSKNESTCAVFVSCASEQHWRGRMWALGAITFLVFMLVIVLTAAYPAYVITDHP